MEIGIFFAPIIAVILMLLLVRVVSLPFWILKNSIIGAIMIYILNFIGIFTLKITFLNCLIAGIFGIPGVIGLIVYTQFLK